MKTIFKVAITYGNTLKELSKLNLFIKSFGEFLIKLLLFEFVGDKDES